jgi:hypothetical protein
MNNNTPAFCGIPQIRYFDNVSLHRLYGGICIDAVSIVNSNI